MLTLQLMATCWPLSVGYPVSINAATLFRCCLLGQETSTECDDSACWEGCLQLMRGKRWQLMQDIFYKSNFSSCFLNADAGNAWQMCHK